MRKGLLVIGLLFLIGLVTAEEGFPSSRLLKIRRSSGPDYTRVVLDLDAPAVYEIQSAANSSILVLQIPKLVLPQGAQEISVEDQVIHRIQFKLGPEPKVIFFMYRPTRWRVFALKPDSEKPDRLVIDVFRPPVETKEKEDKPASLEPKDQRTIPAKIAEPPQPVPEPPKKIEEPSRQAVELPKKAEEPPRPVPEPPKKIEEPPRQAAEVPKKIEEPPPKIEEPPRAVTPEEPRERAVAPSKGVARLLEIRQWSAPEHTRVVIDLDSSIAFDPLPPTDPLIYALSLKGVVLSKGSQEISVGDQVIQKITLAPTGKEEARLTFFLVKPAKVNLFLLNPYLDKPDRLVIDVSRPDLEEKEKVERQVSRRLKARKKTIVVLDPGHGGEDPGAVGLKGTLEKDIVLALAQSLQKVLDGSGEFRAFLTRRGDYFVSLDDRVKVAQEYDADLFISLHANGSKSRQIRGTSIYCLSLKGASDTATQLLAQKENASDLMGGTHLALAQKDLDSILLDLEQTQSINESLQLGGLVLSELSRINPIQFYQPRQAGFAVLKSPGFPSVLVETAYITHPSEEILLGKKSFQDKLCLAIAAAVKKYIPLLAAKEGSPQPEPRSRRKGS